MTDTHATEIQKALPTTAVFLNKESPSRRVGHLQTSAQWQTNQEEDVPVPPEGLLGPLLPVCSGGPPGG